MKRIVITLPLCMIVLTLMLCLSVGAAKNTEIDCLSHGLDVIAAGEYFAKTGIQANEISFTADDFKRMLNVSKLNSVTITEVPSLTEGSLLLGSTVVQTGQTISQHHLSLLRFLPASECAKSSFRFSPDDRGYSVACQLYVIDYVNQSPVTDSQGESLSVSTYRNVSLFGTLNGYDPEGDPVQYEIVSYPKHGTIVMENKTCGSYRYTPDTDYSGEDSFSYVMADCYGNYSSMSTVTMNISKSQISYTFDDLKNSKYQNVAITMAEKHIMEGTKTGNVYLFYPDQTVSRLDFLVMVMKTLGITQVPSVEKTAFADDAMIPDAYKGYVQAAYSMNAIRGYPNGGNTAVFKPDQVITRAEAAVIVHNFIKSESGELLPVFKDSEAAPAWAVRAVYTMNSMGIMESELGFDNLNSEMSKKDVAFMLANLMAVTEK